MYCEKCGNKINETESFCNNCGNKVITNNVNKINNQPAKKFNIGKCFLICIGISIGIFFVTTILDFIMRLVFYQNTIELLRIIKFYLPILIIIFGPFILYAIKNSNNKYN